MELEEELQLEREWKENLVLLTDHEAMGIFFPNRKDKLREVLYEWRDHWNPKYFHLKKLYDQAANEDYRDIFRVMLGRQWEAAKKNHQRISRMIAELDGVDPKKEKDLINFAKIIPLEEIYSFKQISSPRGKRTQASCPFHKERTGSFMIYRDQNTWHCFGECSEGGDSVDFIRKLTGRNLRDSVDFLIKRYAEIRELAPETR